MATQRFQITVASNFPELWRYNIALMCGCFDAAGTRTGFVTAESTVAPAGSNLKARPADCPADRTTRIETPPCERIVCYLYLIPHTLPDDNAIDGCEPFEIEVSITAGGRPLLRERRPINQWSGASIELQYGA